jgi:hypothetical protein
MKEYQLWENDLGKVALYEINSLSFRTFKSINKSPKFVGAGKMLKGNYKSDEFKNGFKMFECNKGFIALVFADNSVHWKN